MASNSNNLNAGMRCIKYMLFLINVMFVITAILLIVIGVKIRGVFSDISVFLDDHFNVPSTLFIVIGSLLLVIALFGCIGAIRESTCLINTYGVFLTIVFILEITAAIFAIALKRQVTEMLTRTMYQAIDFYPQSIVVSKAVDLVQINLECCGVENGAEDWRGILPDSDKYAPEIIVPDSCCRYHYGEMSDCDEFFTTGCFSSLQLFIHQTIVILSISALSVAFVQLLGIICAFMLACAIRRTKSLREVRRWQLQQSVIGLSTEQTHYKTPYEPLEEETEKPNVPVSYVPASSTSHA